MTIIPDDFEFAVSIGVPIPFGSAGDCFSANEDPTCRKGSFMIDLNTSGLKISETVTWKMQASDGLAVADFLNDKGLRVSGRCGGWCGHCKPSPYLKFEMSGCSLDTSKFLWDFFGRISE